VSKVELNKETKDAYWASQSYPPDPGMLDQIECEVKALQSRAQALSGRIGIDEKQSFWAFTMLYLESMKTEAIRERESS